MSEEKINDKVISFVLDLLKEKEIKDG